MPDPNDVDAEAKELSTLLRTIAAYIDLSPVGVIDGHKQSGELVGICPFHVVHAYTATGKQTRATEATLYVSLRGRSWTCVRCHAGGDTQALAVHLEAMERAKRQESPYGQTRLHRGGPSDDFAGEVGPIQEEIYIPAWFGDAYTGHYVLEHAEGRVVYYDWQEGEAAKPATPASPDQDQSGSGP
jgi:hypothetical protein